jgi:hypothetical protein
MPMPCQLYRNSGNRITGLSGEGAYASDEQLELSDSEVKQFLEYANSGLSSSDADTIGSARLALKWLFRGCRRL